MEIRIEIDGQTLDVKGNYTPYDYGVRYHCDGSGTPPSPAEFEIQKIDWVVKVKRTSPKDTKIYEYIDVTDLVFAFDYSFGDTIIEEIEDLCINQIEK
jgi:hypothetical protein